MEVCFYDPRCSWRDQERGTRRRRWRGQSRICGQMAGEQARSSIQSKEDMRLSFTIRTDSPSFSMPRTVAKPYDWTYTTTYSGHQYQEDEASASPASSTSSLLTVVEATPKPGPSCESIPWVAADPEDPSQSIPMAELTRQDPILFYAEIPLFEDELHDNGSSILLIRIVCIPPFLVLERG